MTIRKHNDDKGWQRGEGPYCKSKLSMTTKRDEYTASDKLRNLPYERHGLPADVLLTGGGPVSQGGKPRYKPKTGPRTNKGAYGR